MLLNNKVALVTGAGDGIGRGTSLTLARQGARVMVADINPEAGEQTVAMIRDEGGDALFVSADVANEAQVKNLIETAVEH